MVSAQDFIVSVRNAQARGFEGWDFINAVAADTGLEAAKVKGKVEYYAEKGVQNLPENLPSKPRGRKFDVDALNAIAATVAAA